MKVQDFTKLTARQQHALILAMYVRNAIEDFHVAHLSDAQMKELNPLIRQALFDIITFLETEDLQNDKKAQFSYSWLVESIPSYWEIPERATYNDDDQLAA